MNKALHLTAAVHEMQLFSAAAGLYITVFQKHQCCLLSDAWSTGKHLVIKREERKCFLNATTCSLIAGMFGCSCRAGPFHRGKQKMKVTQAGCQNLRTCSTYVWAAGGSLFRCLLEVNGSMSSVEDKSERQNMKDKMLKRLTKENAGKLQMQRWDEDQVTASNSQSKA